VRWLNREARALLAAAVFFSRLPVPSRPLVDAADLKRAATWWPLLGLMTGGVMAAVWAAARPVLGAGAAAGVAIIIGVLLTGSLEEDGIADVCDGFGAGTTRSGALAFMHDSCLGPHAVLGVAMVLGLRWQVLASLPAGKVVAALLASEAAGRAFAVALMAVLPYARDGSSRARPVVGRQSAARLMIAAATGLAPFALGVPAVALPAGLIAWCGCVI
jgi:adenosylcobinamide-GDP ribazoletransferase